MNEEAESIENAEEVDNWQPENEGDESSNNGNVETTPKKQEIEKQDEPPHFPAETKQDSDLTNALDDLLGGTPYHLRDGLQNQNASINRLTNRANKLKEELESGDSEVMVANLNAFLAEANILKEEVEKLQGFFNKDLSLRDRQFVEKSRLLDIEIQNINKDLKEFLTNNKEIKDFVGDIRSHIDNIKEQSNYATQINNTTLEKLKSLNESINFANYSLMQFRNNLQNKLEAEMTARVESLSELVGEFYTAKEAQKQEFVDNFYTSFENAQSEVVEKITSTNQNIVNMLENAKKMIFGIGAILLVGGIATGAFSGLAYSKYSQYKDIESRLNEISSQLDGVKVLKNKQNNIVLVVPKEAKIESYGNEYTINLGGR